MYLVNFGSIQRVPLFQASLIVVDIMIELYSNNHGCFGKYNRSVGIIQYEYLYYLQLWDFTLEKHMF